MRFFDTDMQKTSKGIINALNLKESAASVKAQIHKDEPEEAPKETKDALVKKVQNPKIPTKQALKEDIEDVQNQIAELQDYLNNTPEISDDEREAIQAEIDELLDEVNFYDAGLDMEVEEPSEDDLHLGESVEDPLNEAPNPENAEINKKILSTIRAKSDIEPRYADDLRAAGLTVEPDEYNKGHWTITGPNGRKITKDNFLGGKYAEFQSGSKKDIDYLNYLTKDYDSNKYSHRDTKWTKPVQGKDRHYRKNPETGEYEWQFSTDYYDKPYSKRQKDSQGYNYDSLKGGSKNVRDYKDASNDYDRYKAGGRLDQWHDEDIADAQKAYDDFQASISSKLAELKAKIDDAKKSKQYGLDTAARADAKRKEIVNNVRAKRNQNK